VPALIVRELERTERQGRCRQHQRRSPARWRRARG
jgi:hypothetical protein